MVSAGNPADSVPGFAGDGPATADTVSAGAMHLAGGIHAELSAPSGMLFAGGGTGGLDVQFVDLTAASGRQVGSAGGSTVVGAAPDQQVAGTPVANAPLAAALDTTALDTTALETAHPALPGAFCTGPSSGVPGGAMRPDAVGRGGSAALFGAPRPPLGVPAKVWD